MAIIRVPYGNDGMPLPIEVPIGFLKVSDNPAGFTHNESECDFVQVDPQEDEFGGAPNFWTADELTWDEKTKAEAAAHYLTNGKYNLWIKKSGDNIYRMSQYDVTRGFSPAEVERNEAFYGGTGAALRDGEGELITDVGGDVIFAA